MTARDAGVSVYLLAHQDDEFFCQAQIAADVAAAREVCVVLLTDGGEVREAESTTALTSLGVNASAIHFLGRRLGIQDGSLYRCADVAYAALRDLLEGVASRVVTVRMPAWEGGHHDHDMLHGLGVLLWRALLPSAEAWQFPLYTGFLRPLQWCRVALPLDSNGAVRVWTLSASERAAALNLSASYPSQARMWKLLVPRMAARLRAYGGFIEQPVSVARLSTKPHRGRLHYELRYRIPYAVVRTAIADVADMSHD